MRMDLEVNEWFQLEQGDEDRGYGDGDEDALSQRGVGEACDHQDIVAAQS